MIRKVPDRLAHQFLQRDMNKDGDLNIDGFLATLMASGA